MAFTSFNFLIFFPVVAVACYLTPSKYRWITLLIASYFFYISMKPVYAVLTAGITLSTYIFTRLMEGRRSEVIRKRLMLINIGLILLPLLFFKYFGVINNGLLAFIEKHNLSWPLPEMKLLLPVGISFYTFMAIGYTIDVFNEEIKPEKNIGILALFVSFFPLVLSGPIERAKNMLPQFSNIKGINYNNIVKGLKFILWGYFMKLVVADRIGIYTDAIFNNISQHSGSSLLFASLLYPFQVYGDFGGYSLIALGTAKILGFNVINNFNRPFFSISIAEFWRRWHISLIRWLTDYVYTPLAFSFRKVGIMGIVSALMLTFLITGIWHGANLTFIIWGLLQGIFLSIEAATNRKRTKLEKKYGLRNNLFYIFINMLITYIVFSATVIFGRGGSIEDALLIFHRIFTVSGPLFIDKTTLAYSILGLSILVFKDLKDEFFPEKLHFFDSKIIYVRYLAYLFITFMILLTGVLNGGQFIYFQF